MLCAAVHARDRRSATSRVSGRQAVMRPHRHLATVLLLAFAARTWAASVDTGRILVVPVLIAYERVDDGERLPEAAFGGAELEAWIDALGNAVLGTPGDAAGASQPAAQSPDPGILSGAAGHMVRGNLPPDQALAEMRPVCAGTSADSVLFQYLHVKVGLPRGWKHEGVPLLYEYWKPVVNMSRTRLRAVLRSCRTGRLVWQDGFQIRTLPEPGNPELEQALTAIYQQLIPGGTR